MNSEFLTTVGCICGTLVIAVIVFGIFNVPFRMAAMNVFRERREHAHAVRETGVTAPAIIRSAKYGGIEKMPGGSREMKITYELDVQPEGQPSFPATIQIWSKRHVNMGYTVKGGELQGEAGGKIWVTYNPNDPAQMIFEYYDESREKAVKREAFVKINHEIGVLRETGVEALATILEAEDLRLEFELEANSTMRFKFEVTPNSGAPFQAKSMLFVKPASRQLYTVGKKVYVKYDPNKPEWAVLIRPAA